jgi:hypothetical protein
MAIYSVKEITVREPYEIQADDVTILDGFFFFSNRYFLEDSDFPVSQTVNVILAEDVSSIAKISEDPEESEEV